MSYNQTEIPTDRNDWIGWLRMFFVGEKKLADIKDRSKIATSIANNFHKGTQYRFKTRKVDEETFEVQRLPDEETIRYKGYECSICEKGYVIYKRKEYIGTGLTKRECIKIINNHINK